MIVETDFMRKYRTRKTSKVLLYRNVLAACDLIWIHAVTLIHAKRRECKVRIYGGGGGGGADNASQHRS